MAIPNIFSDQFIELPETGRGTSSLEKQEARAAQCGQTFSHFNPETGRPGFYERKCGMFRLCDRCLEERANGFRIEMSRAAEQHGWAFFMKVVSPEERKSFVRQFKRSEYRCFPLEDGSFLIFYVNRNRSPDKNLESWENLSEEDLRDELGGEVAFHLVDVQNWNSIAKTPEGKNVSGNLGKPAISSKDRAVVENWAIRSDLTLDQERACLEQACKETSDLDPHTPEEVEAALAVRKDAALRILKEHGAKKIECFSIRESIRISHINWRTPPPT